jgi:hypothetical protein
VHSTRCQRLFFAALLAFGLTLTFLTEAGTDEYKLVDSLERVITLLQRRVGAI